MVLQYLTMFLIGFFGSRSYIKYALDKASISKSEVMFALLFLFLFSISLLDISQNFIYLVLVLYGIPIINLMIIYIKEDLSNWGRWSVVIWLISFLGFLDYYLQSNVLNNLIQYVKAFVS